MSNYEQVVKTLQDAKAEITDLLKDEKDHSHALRITTSLQRLTDNFALLTGIKAESETPESGKLGPATTIAGEKISTPKKVVAEDLKPKDEKVELLKAQVAETYKTFLTTDNKELLKVDHLVLRGVAKKAGLQVTKDEPKKLDVNFIKDVKAAIEKQVAVLNTKISDAIGKLDAAKVVAKQLEDEKAPAEQLQKAHDDVAAAFQTLETLQNSIV